MNYSPLLFQVPAIFTAVPMVHRLLPFKLAARAIPLFYAVISWLVMAMPDRIDLGLAAAGLVTLLHNRVGLRLAEAEAPDVQVAVAWCRDAYAAVTNLLLLGLDSLSLSVRPSQKPIVDDGSEDDKSGDDEDKHPDPPHPPANPVARIPRL